MIPRTLVILWLALQLSGCTSINLLSSAWTPAQAVNRQVMSGWDLQILGTHRDPLGRTVVLYTYMDRGIGDFCDFSIGYSITKYDFLSGWSIQSWHESGMPVNCQPRWASPITYATFGKIPPQKDYTAIYGPIFDKDLTTSDETVRFIGAVFSDGIEVIDDASKGYFLIFSPEGLEVCELKVYGEAGEIIHHYNWRTGPAAPERCR
jgi:hypothetical protein